MGVQALFNWDVRMGAAGAGGSNDNDSQSACIRRGSYSRSSLAQPQGAALWPGNFAAGDTCCTFLAAPLVQTVAL
jgi:hypothetical protein